MLVNNAGIVGPLGSANPENIRLADWRAVQQMSVADTLVRCRRAVAGGLISATVLICGIWAGGAAAQEQTTEKAADGTVHVRAFDLPLSSFLSPESQAIVKRMAAEHDELMQHCKIDKIEDLDGPSILVLRECFDKRAAEGLVARLRARYPVEIQRQKIAGVTTDIVTPTEGVSAANRQRVLINLHGGGFVTGNGGLTGQSESIPIASVGKFKVVSIDYRQAPEYRFPAASEDVAAVYRELLKTYEPKNIGIYGCSAGGLLTAEALAWFQRKGLPTPGAAGIFCSGASYWGEGDTGPFVAAVMDIPLEWVANPKINGYFKDTATNDPLAFPIRSEEIIAQFPPSLLISATRDQALSSVVALNSRLVALGVKSEMHIWEGLGHGFFSEPDLKESREAYDVIAKFFDRQLGQATPAVAPRPSLRERLQPEIDAFAAADEQSPPATCQFLFLGSSSFVNWKAMAADMAPLPVVNRGFGGAQIEYVNLWFDRAVAPYKPRAIVFYAGENDIDAGKSVERVVADFDIFMHKKTAAFGKTPVYFISVKPSKLRYWQLGQQAKVNDAVRARAKKRSDLHYIDVVTPMLKDGKPMDLFVGDNVHMNAQGYEIWTKVVKAALTPQSESQARACQRTAAQ